VHPKSDKSLSALLVPIDGTESDLVDFGRGLCRRSSQRTREPHAYRAELRQTMPELVGSHTEDRKGRAKLSS